MPRRNPPARPHIVSAKLSDATNIAILARLMAAELESRASALESRFWRVPRENPHQAEMGQYAEEVLQFVQRVWRAMSGEHTALFVIREDLLEAIELGR